MALVNWAIAVADAMPIGHPTKRTQSPCELVGLARDEQADAVVLAAQLRVEVILELGQRRVRAARDGDGGGLVLGGVRLDVVLERVVVDVICMQRASTGAPGSAAINAEGNHSQVAPTEAPLWYRLPLKLLAVFHSSR